MDGSQGPTAGSVRRWMVMTPIFSLRSRTRSIGRCLSNLPADPVADRPAHDQLLVGFGEPGQLGEMRDALSPRARHARDVGAPEHAPRPEGIVERAVGFVQAAEGIVVGGVAGPARGLDGDVGM